jgi:hypothetical protein
MKRSMLLLTLLVFSAGPMFPQIEDRFTQITGTNAVDYVRPFVTTLGSAANSNGYYTADIPAMFSFSISFRGMYILIPESQKSFTPDLSSIGYQAYKETATIYGDKGAAYAGPDGYVVMPPGINQSGIPIAFPQVSASFLGTQVILRYLPQVKIADNNDLDMLGVGVAHNISQYFSMFPVDIALQLLYNNVKVSDIMKMDNLAFNIHMSKTLGVFTPYFGIQWEKTSLDLNYTIKGDPQSGDPALRTDTNISVSTNGDNNFRTTVGAALKLAILVFNADVSFSSQTIFTGGATFEF